MPFLRVHNLMSRSPPGRLYDHSSGKDVFPVERDSATHLINNFATIDKEEIDYFIAISWGEEGRRILDVFGYSGLINNWKANPEVRNWILNDGKIDYTRNITCGEGLILIGREEEHRLKTKNLQEYLSVPLNLGEINRIIGRK